MAHPINKYKNYQIILNQKKFNKMVHIIMKNKKFLKKMKTPQKYYLNKLNYLLK